MRSQLLLGAAFAATAAASPVIKNREVTTVTVSGATATTYPQPALEIQGFPIHPSCNNTERIQLEKALGDTIKIAQQAAQHIYAHGNESEIYSRYFGQAPTAEVIGWYEKLIYGDHEGVLFRCDDIDGNCHQEGMLISLHDLCSSSTNTISLLGWGGHWRGENATDETVICPLSYTTRKPLETMCSNGYTIANNKLATYFAADLMHRLYHTTKIGEGAAEHYADTYSECLELAQNNSAEAVRNTHSLQYFALDVYAMEVALPGEGCTGTPAEEEVGSHGASASSVASSAGASASSVPAPASSAASSAVSSTSSAAASTTAVQAASQTASKTSSAATVSFPSISTTDQSSEILIPI